MTATLRLLPVRVFACFLTEAGGGDVTDVIDSSSGWSRLGATLSDGQAAR